jgi:lipopolysaccharide assembly outer membrane protein LptD (OstA)
MTWNLQNQTVVSDQAVRVVHQQQQVNLTADRGQLDLQQRTFYLTGNVHGVGQRNQSKLDAEQLTWNIPTQAIMAEGNVVYDQANPPLHLKGPKAVGTLQGQSVVISGGETGGRVVTEIIP